MKKRAYRRLRPDVRSQPPAPAHTREDTLAVLGLLALAYTGEPSLPQRLDEAAQELMQRERGQ